jgi:hypothetical protein
MMVTPIEGKLWIEVNMEDPISCHGTSLQCFGIHSIYIYVYVYIYIVHNMMICVCVFVDPRPFLVQEKLIILGEKQISKFS